MDGTGVLKMNQYTQKGIKWGEKEKVQNGVTICWDGCGNQVDKYWDSKKTKFWVFLNNLFNEWSSPYQYDEHDGINPDDLPKQDGGDGPPSGTFPVSSCPDCHSQ